MVVVPVRHVPVIGGLAAWHIPLVTATLGFGALGLGLMEIVLAVALLGYVAQTGLRGLVVEISPRGLTRGFFFNGRFRGCTTVMAWDAVASVHTGWRRLGDDTALLTTVRDGQGHAIHLTTAMGLRAYWSCVASVAAGAPAARRSGLTDALVSHEPPDRRSVLDAAATAATLALVLAALVGVHYLWAQGRSSLERSLEETAASAETAPTAQPGPRPPAPPAL